MKEAFGDGVCSWCGTDFRSRLRLVHHLGKRGRRCNVQFEAAAADGTLPQLSPEAAAAAAAIDLQLRVAARLEGRHELQGPPCLRAAA